MLKTKKELVLYCDGRCEGVGDSALGSYAYVIYFGSEKIMDGSGDVGRGSDITANVAEYVAVLRGLETLRTAGYTGQSLLVRSDSRIVMQQLGMLCAVRSKRLLKWWYLVREIAKEFDISFEWIPRTWNKEADRQVRYETI